MRRCATDTTSCTAARCPGLVHGQLESLAALVPYIWLGERLTNARRLHYVNNTSAVAALAKGYSGSPDSGHLVHALHATALGLGCSCYFEYVLLHCVEYTV